MIKEKIISQVRAHVFGGKPTVDRLYQADPRRLELDITAALNTIFFQIFKKNPSNLDRYSKPYNDVVVSYDPDRLQYYSILPAPVIQYPTCGDGIWNINTMEGVDVTFAPVQMRDMELLHDNEFDDIDDVIGYSLSGSRITYYNFDPIITAVRMDLVVPFTEWLSTDDVPIPAGQDLEIINIVRQMQGLVPIDKLNNQNEKA